LNLDADSPILSSLVISFEIVNWHPASHCVPLGHRKSGHSKDFITGQTDLSGAALQAILLLVGAGIFGFAMGYLYLKTDKMPLRRAGESSNSD